MTFRANFHCFLLLLILLPSLSPSLLAQKEDDPISSADLERIRQARQTFLTQRLALSPKEAEKFFPVFWRYEAEQKSLFRGRHLRPQADDARESPTEAEARRLLANQLENEAAILELRRRAIAEYLTLLPATKVLQIGPAEKEFRRQLVNRVRGNHGPATGHSADGGRF